MAAQDETRWWEPAAGYFWPDEVPRDYCLEAYEAAYGLLGYSQCDSEREEVGYEKVTLFVNAHGFTTHACRQLENGRWTSKLGKLEDIEHELRALERGPYGRVAVIMKRPRGGR